MLKGLAEPRGLGLWMLQPAAHRPPGWPGTSHHLTSLCLSFLTCEKHRQQHPRGAVRTKHGKWVKRLGTRFGTQPVCYCLAVPTVTTAAKRGKPRQRRPPYSCAPDSPPRMQPLQSQHSPSSSPAPSTRTLSCPRPAPPASQACPSRWTFSITSYFISNPAAPSLNLPHLFFPLFIFTAPVF